MPLMSSDSVRPSFRSRTHVQATHSTQPTRVSVNTMYLGGPAWVRGGLWSPATPRGREAGEEARARVCARA